MPQIPTVPNLVSWCQDWFWRSPRSLQAQIDKLNKRVTALEGASTTLKAVRTQLKKEIDSLDSAGHNAPPS